MIFVPTFTICLLVLKKVNKRRFTHRNYDNIRTDCEGLEAEEEAYYTLSLILVLDGGWVVKATPQHLTPPP